MRRVFAAALLLLAVPSTAAIAQGPFTDPGGSDASDDRDDPTTLPGPGHYNGTLLPPGDADWYELAADAGTPPAACIELVVDAHANARLNLSMQGYGDLYYAAGNVTPDRETALGLAVPAFHGTTFGLAPIDGDARSVGAYELTLRKPTLSEAPSGSPTAGAPEDGSDEEPPCLVETLDAGGHLERTVPVTEGDRLTVSLAQATAGTVRLTLTDPDGQTRRTIGADAGNVTHITADVRGNWTITATNLDQQSSSQMAIGLSVVDDCQLVCTLEDPEEEEEEGGPCRPYCLTAVAAQGR